MNVGKSEILTKVGQEYWERAKQVIPGGNQLLSKRPEMFLPGLWPAYYEKAKGCEVWDVDGNKYYDFAMMGIGACTLGFADDDVNSVVLEAVDGGSMATLNCYEEVLLAEKLVALHSWSDMVRFSRSGGEACAIAVRIARAKTRRNKIAFCGYHGWHDWYLAANIEDKKNLDQQLLSGLDSAGVASELSGTALPFSYNDISSLNNIINKNKNEIAAIFMEPVRSSEPDPHFLESVRKLATNNGIVLIFDEITSGFRNNIGGVHLTYGVDPDIAVFGKALGNGYPISAIVGSRDVMSAAQSTFISSTMWTERVGFVAALATIDKMERLNVPADLIKWGLRVNKAWLSASAESGLEIGITGIAPLTHINFIHEKSVEIQTLYTQEMLKRGFLAGGNVYATFAYTDEILDLFSKAVHEAFQKISETLFHGDFNESLQGQTKHTGFQRLA
jgi:glutamate-1-semialdehyde aminotransferase